MTNLRRVDLLDVIPGPDNYWEIAKNVLESKGFDVPNDDLLISDAISWYRYVRLTIVMIELGRLDEAGFYLKLACDLDRTYGVSIVTDLVIPRLVDYCPDFSKALTTMK